MDFRLLTSRLNLWVAGRLTLNTEVVNGRSHLTIFVDSYVEVLMDQEVVPGPLAYDLEIVHKRGLEPYLAIEGSLRHTCRLILVTGYQACAADSLWLEVELGVSAALVVNRSDEQDVKRPAKLDEFSRPAPCTGDKHKYFSRDSNVISERSGFSQSRRYAQYADQAQRGYE